MSVRRQSPSFQLTRLVHLRPHDQATRLHLAPGINNLRSTESELVLVVNLSFLIDGCKVVGA